MAVHKFKPGESVTFTASADIAENEVVAVTGNRTVGPAAAATAAKVIGSAATAATSGDEVLVLIGGVQRLIAASDVTAGDQVVAVDAAKIATVPAVAATPTEANGNATRAIIGIALTSVDVSEVTDDRVEVLMFR